jgi:hypothetical protein
MDDGDDILLLLQDGKRLTSMGDNEPQSVAAFALNNVTC